MEKLSWSPAGARTAALVVPVVVWLLECAPTAGAPPRSSAVMDPQPAATASPSSHVDFVVDEAAPCPLGMALVDGDYCPNVRQTCLRWADPPESRYAHLRCAEFKEPAVCEGARAHQRYCIDREEYVRPPETVPTVHASWDEAQEACAERGARLCTEAQWQFACEGEQMLPYPYGFTRDPTACNFDRTDLGKPEEGLTDHRAPTAEFPRCVSPFGVHDMVGNVDEWTERQGMSAPNRSALHGGWWLPGRNNCRAATLEHTEDYSAKQVGFRCCRSAQARGPQG